MNGNRSQVIKSDQQFMKINEHYTITDVEHTLRIELASPHVSFASPLADLLIETAILKRSFSQTQTGLRMQYLDDDTKRQVFSFLSDVSIIQLKEQTGKLLQREKRREEMQRELDQERQRILTLTPNEFGKLLESASQSKLKFISVTSGLLRISPSQLLPVTHFKKFARLGSWLGNEEQFAYPIPLCASTRERLVEAATTLSRSTKKVTKNDIDVRRKSVEERKNVLAGVVDADLWEYAEDFGMKRALEMQAKGLLRNLKGYD